MSWRDRYRPASFRGIPFFVESSDSSHGRRVQVHEYPFRDVPFVEDLGRRARGFELDGYLVGPDYDLQRDQLLSALEKEGSGELIHPYRGTLQVTPGPCTVREESRDGGTCRIRMAFIETGLAVNPTSPTAPLRATARAADNTGLASAAAAAARIRVVKRPAFVSKAVEQSWFASLKAILALPLQDLEEVRRLVARAGEDVVERIALPITFCTDAVRLVQAIIGTAAGKIAAVKAYLQLAATIPQSIRGTSDQARVAVEGSHAITQLVRETAVAEAARAAAAATWESYEQALAAREAILDSIEDVSLTASDEVQQVLSELRRQLVGAVPTSASNLPHLDQFIPPGTMPVLVIAYQLYDARGRAQEIVTRNGIADPLAVPGGEPIEVLIDAA